ncbi:hypothetical protein C8J57DRAFT_1535003 [Mycena rebaudengoi]|nr:hypothetical protein C8J57DRAFT_1535003 [Mycena rebaudengoi]
MHRSDTPTAPIFRFSDLKNAGPLTHASYRPPRSQCVPSTRSRERIAQYYDPQGKPWQFGSVDSILVATCLDLSYCAGPYRVLHRLSVNKLASQRRAPIGVMVPCWLGADRCLVHAAMRAVYAPPVFASSQRRTLKRTAAALRCALPCYAASLPTGPYDAERSGAYIAGGTPYDALPHPRVLFRYSVASRVARTSAWVESAAADATDEGTPLRPSSLSTRKIVYARPDVLPLDSAPTRLGREPSPP